MKKSLTVGCVIMASGLSRRFGANKLLADFAASPCSAGLLPPLPHPVSLPAS